MKHISLQPFLAVLALFLADAGIAAAWMLFDDTDLWVIPQRILAKYPDFTPTAYVWNMSCAARAMLIYIAVLITQRLPEFDFFDRIFLFLCLMFSAIDLADSIFDFNQRVMAYDWQVWGMFAALILGTKIFFKMKNINVAK
jgi:hypothetical protein